jgi:hypothetical protein
VLRAARAAAAHAASTVGAVPGVAVASPLQHHQCLSTPAMAKGVRCRAISPELEHSHCDDAAVCVCACKS